ncbi:MAG: LptA/OstA family protein [Cephaloticoccus sp.]
MNRLLSSLAAGLVIAAPLLRAQSAEPPPTVIECSGPAETISSDTETIATFRDQVVVTGNNIKLTCDFLKVVAIRKGDPSSTLGSYGYFKSLVATGRVRIEQGDREATCGRAEVFPGEDRIVLSEDPVVRSFDDEYIATGPRLVLYRGQRRAVIEGNETERSRIVLPAIKDLGFDETAAPAPDGNPQP